MSSIGIIFVVPFSDVVGGMSLLPQGFEEDLSQIRAF
jgi:hypothetical protein